MKKLLFILFFPLIVFTSCTSTFELINGKSGAILMERDKDILLATAKNGYYEDKEYKLSGKKTTESMRNKLRRYASSVDITDKSSFKKIDKEILLDYDYVVVPEIYHWEDRATNMNFLPDKVIFGITVYDNTGVLLNHIEIKGQSTTTTFSNNDPIELVNEGLDTYIRKLFEL